MKSNAWKREFEKFNKLFVISWKKKSASVCKIRVTNVILSTEVSGGELGSKWGRGVAPALRDLRYFRSLRRTMLRGASCRIGARG